MSFFEELGKSISGQTNREIQAANLQAQERYNQQLIDLQREKLQFEQSPEYQKQQRVKIIVVGVIILFVGFITLKITKVI